MKKKIFKHIYVSLLRILPIKKDKIVFCNFSGRGYGDNPKYIAEEIHKRNLNIDMVWLCADKETIFPPYIRFVKMWSLRHYYELATAGAIVSNVRIDLGVEKRKKQTYLQTWHGTPLKKLAFDIEVPEGTTFYRSGMNEEMMHETYAQDVKKYNYMISPSAFTTEIFQSAFRINRERLIETGYPRNDFLTNYTEEDVLNIKKKLGIPLDKKVLLYAPTWRDNSYITKGYTFKLEVHFDKWQKILGDEYVIVFKPHYLIVNDFDIDQYQGFVYFVEANEDISNLYIIADALVTDYSSVFFDYAILKRPIYFYMYDLIHYRDELRGFYLDVYHDLPGDIIEDENQLLEEIKKGYDYQRLDKFNQRFNNHEDGKASKRVVDIVFK